MAAVYTVTISNTTPVEITGGRVGHFILQVESYHGSLYLGGPNLSVSYSPTVVANGLSVSEGSSQWTELYVTSPDEIYALIATDSVSSDTMKIFHNR
mgnify:CR=1 FL=1